MTAFLLSMIVGAFASPAMAVSDTQPPVLTALSFSTSTIDVRSSAQTLNVTATMTDDLSGVSFDNMSFQAPPGSSNSGSTGGGCSASTPAKTVTCTASIPFKMYIPNGTYSIGQFIIADAAGNETVMSASDLVAAGFPSTIQVLSNPDTKPPVLTAFSITPSSVDVRAASQNVYVTATLSDDLSGVNFINMSFNPAPGTGPGSTGNGCSPNTTLPSTSNSVTCTTTLPIKQFVASGTWTANIVILADNAGNEITLSAADLAAQGFANSFQVVSNTDTQPPKLTGLSFSTSTVDVRNGPQQITITASMTDDVSGDDFINMGFYPPPGGTGVTGGGCSFSSLPPAIGQVVALPLPKPKSATCSFTLTFNQYIQSGTWTLNNVILADAAGNEAVLNAPDLAAMGFPSSIQVVA